MRAGPSLERGGGHGDRTVPNREQVLQFAARSRGARRRYEIRGCRTKRREVTAGTRDESAAPTRQRIVGRYVLHDAIARGGMATVYLGRLRGAAGFARLVAVKQLHPQYARDPGFVAMFTDEARLAARVRHPNVVPTLDVVRSEGELFLVMELVVGETLSRLLRPEGRERDRAPVRIAAAIVAGVLHGLHAAHEARGEKGEALGIVHRDVSPQNILVGVDGVARVLDFGVAKAVGRSQETTQGGAVKGKLGYMAPEQLTGDRLDRRADVFATGVVLWEALVGERAFRGEEGQTSIARVMEGEIEPPSEHVMEAAVLDEVVLRALDPRAEGRFATALEMARAIEATVRVATPAEVGAWVLDRGEIALEELGRHVALLESTELGASTLVSSHPPPSAIVAPRPSRRRLGVVAAALTLLLVGTAMVFVASRDRASVEPTGAASASASASAPVDPSLASSSAPSSPTPPPIAPSSSSKPSRAQPAKPARSDCTPPYFTDPNGVRRYKQHCLR